MPPKLDTIAGRYVLESEISRGGMATVWLARDNVLARPVAIKILHPHLSEDDAFLGRFRREALAAARLSHPNIVSIYDTGTHESEVSETDVQYIVMEYCGGGTLADQLARGPLDPNRVAGFGATICDALGYAHRQELVHRDVKPGNVLLADDGLLKVADFGIAKAAFVKSDITTTGSILGTVTYISPEQARGEEPDHRSDLYALGVVLYEMLVGRPPFAGDTQIATAMMHVKEPPPTLRSIKAGIPRPLESTVLKALEKDPDDRFATAEEMAAELESAVGGAGATSVVPATPTAAPARSPVAAPASGGDTGWLLRVLAAIAAVVVVVVLATSLLGDGDEGGPSGEPSDSNQGAAAAGAALDVASVADFDPHGGDGEHPEDAPAAADGNESTAWSTQTYSASLELQGKPGVGLLFDLGDAATVEGVTITGSPGMSIEVRAGDESGGDETAFEEVASEDGTAESFDLSFDATEARYWLVWITNLSESGTGTASIAEVEFHGG
ncbi:MAG TPA: protein kinase [Actinomycetota bacterium]|nr:protein kinase [Actinomycetota bacterium]